MSAIKDKQSFLQKWTDRCIEIIYTRHSLTNDELDYVLRSVDKLRDEKLKSYISKLIGWGDKDRIELDVFCKVALEVMEECAPSRLRAITQKIELKLYERRRVKEYEEDKTDEGDL